jgi:segregation and condensation protein B
VNSDGVLRALSDRGLVAEAGRDERPGRPVLFGTTPEFLERIGLSSLSGLPPLAPLLGNGDGTPRASLGEDGGDGDVTPDDGAESSTG